MTVTEVNPAGRINCNWSDLFTHMMPHVNIYSSIIKKGKKCIALKKKYPW